MDVFVYGTLTEPDRVAEVLDSFVFVGPATLTGLRLVKGRYPTLAPVDGATAGDDRTVAETAGRLLRTEAIDALDEYERVDDELYRRVTVPLDAPDAPDAPDASDRHPDEAAVYIGDPNRLDADATWPGDGGFDERVVAHLDRSDVRVRLTP
ncbi:AIG2 family protein [Halorubrum aidingense JCM 13560]|uniref:AIG2 family protein n=1 Tax=Halorubrum aidingense JCM 13560 TaxID=1230454 RepID=M0P4V6_9EURY|nr:gamma-glutamylcyclotransferase family protein [Halorubrum aidingense]EMA65177.1 AIG2 family protein [Halorubrum aidingense JCM 13560]